MSWSYKNLSANFRYAHLRALLLVEILEQPMRMLKNKHSIILHWKYLYRIGPRLVEEIYHRRVESLNASGWIQDSYFSHLKIVLLLFDKTNGPHKTQIENI